METSFDLKNIATENRMVMTDRDITMMFDITGYGPEWFGNKSIVNLGAGKSHWGLDLTRIYGVVAKRFENLDIAYAQHGKVRSLLGKLVMAETPGDLKTHLPYEDNSFDLVWNSITPKPNYPEIWRIIKPGGEGYVIRDFGKSRLSQTDDQFKQSIGLPEEASVELRSIAGDISQKHSISESQVLVIKKPV